MKKPKVDVQHARRKGSKTIEVTVYFPVQQKRIYISTHITTDYWDSHYKKLDYSDPEYSSKTIMLNELVGKVHQTIEQMEASGVDNTRENFVRIMSPEKVDKSPENDFIKFASQELESNKSIALSTRTTNERTLFLLREMSHPVLMSDINYAFATRWDNFLRTKFTSQNSITKHHTILRKYIHLAEKHLMIPSEMVKNYKLFVVPRYTSTRKPLTKSTVDQLEEIEYEWGHQFRIYRDAFLFACYTGLRISDIISITTDNFRIDDDGSITLIKIMVKLAKRNIGVRLPLSKLFDGRPAEIIKPYLDEREDGERIFNRSEDVIRRSLKIIAADHELPVFKFHESRYTFLTNLAAKTGDVFKVMKYGGISKIETAQGYIKIAQNQMDDDLDMIDW